MGIVEDILKALDRIPGWKRLQELPPEVDQLKKKVADLEEKLSGKWPADVCRLCGERGARIGHTHLEKTVVVERFDCEVCKQTDFRYRKAS